MKSNYIPPLFTNGKQEDVRNRSEQAYVNSFHKTVFLRGAKNFGLLFVGCLAIISFCIVGIPSITGINKNDTLTAQSQSVVKFTKVDDANQNVGANDVTALASSIEKKDSNTRKFENDSMTKIDLNIADENIANEKLNDVPENLIDGDKSIEEFTVKTTCSSNVRGEPEKGDNVITTVKRGTELNVIGENGDWYKIKWKDDGFAYINKTCFE